MSFKCCLVIQTITGTLDNPFNNFRHFAIYPNFSIFFFFFLLLLLLLLLLFLFGRATVKLKCNVSRKTIGGYLKYQYPLQWAFKSAIFLMRLRGMDQNSFFLDAIDCKAIKFRPMPTIKTAFLVMALRQKLPKPSFKSYVNNFSLRQACFLKLKFPCLKFSKFSVRSI